MVDLVLQCATDMPELKPMICEATSQAEIENMSFQSKINNLSLMLKRLISNSIDNSKKTPQGRRHDAVIKKFALSLYIFSGSLAYHFLHQNLPQSLPSLRTVQRMIHKEYSSITEGEFRFDELLKHIDYCKAPKIIAIGEDATKVVRRVQYDPETNRMVGFVLPCDDTGLPLTYSFLANSLRMLQISTDI